MADDSIGIRRRPKGMWTRRRLAEVSSEIRLNSPPESLDLVHVTNAGRGQRILQARKIQASPCKVFNVELVYTFIARPAFRLPDGDEKSDQISRFPVAFIISAKDLGRPYHVYPFDTGAAVRGKYGRTVDPEVSLEEYELEPTLESALRHIAWAFESKAAYLDGTLKGGLSEAIPHWNSAVRGWVTIAGLSGLGDERPDDRSSAIEVAYKKDIDLQQYVRLVILPQQLLEDSRGDNYDVIGLLDRLGLPHQPYDWRPNETPDSFIDEISRIVRRHLEDEGQI
jgi:hypothetical protein